MTGPMHQIKTIKNIKRIVYFHLNNLCTLRHAKLAQFTGAPVDDACASYIAYTLTGDFRSDGSQFYHISTHISAGPARESSLSASYTDTECDSKVKKNPGRVGTTPHRRNAGVANYHRYSL